MILLDDSPVLHGVVDRRVPLLLVADPRGLRPLLLPRLLQLLLRLPTRLHGQFLVVESAGVVGETVREDQGVGGILAEQLYRQQAFGRTDLSTKWHYYIFHK